MPNGRSGGFVIEKADLKNLVKTIPDTTVIPRILSRLRSPALLTQWRHLDLSTNA